MSTVRVLLAFRLRRDRILVPVWALAIAAFSLFGAAALAQSYGSAASRAEAIRIISLDPSLRAIRGAPDGASLGGFFALEMVGYLALMVAFMNSFLAVRHSRADEELGRSELLAATRAGRTAMTVATVLHAVIANALVGVLSTLAMMAAGYGAAGSLTLGWALATTGLAFFGIGLVLAQVFGSSRGANGWGTALVGVAFILRAAGDAEGTPSADHLTVTPAFASWLSPIGWAQRAEAFTVDRAWPGLVSLALAAVLIAVALGLQAVRDNAAGLVPARSGRAWAGALRSPFALAWRLQRGSIIGWGIGALVTGAMIGALGQTLVDAVSKTPGLSHVIVQMGNGSRGSMLEIFVGVMLGLVGLLVAGSVIQTGMRLRQEEAAGTAEIVLATPVSRFRWYAGYIVLALVSAAVALVLAGLAAGLVLANHGESGLVGQALVLALGQLPAVAAYLAVVALAFAIVPKATVAVGWTVLGLGVFVGEFGALLGVPEWVRELVPSSHVPQPPLASADWSGAWVMASASVVALLIAGGLIRRRELVSA